MGRCAACLSGARYQRQRPGLRVRATERGAHARGTPLLQRVARLVGLRGVNECIECEATPTFRGSDRAMKAKRGITPPCMTWSQRGTMGRQCITIKYADTAQVFQGWPGALSGHARPF